MSRTFLWSSVRSQPWHNRHSFIVLDGWLRAPSSCLSLATQNWMTSLLLRMGRHPQQRQMFQFDHHHNEADDVTSRSVLLGSAGGEAKQLTTRLGVGDRTFRSASAAPIAHGRGVQRREPDGVAVSSTLHVRMDGTLVSSVLPWCDSRHASRTGLQCGTVTQERRAENPTTSSETCPRANTDATRPRVSRKDCRGRP